MHLDGGHQQRALGRGVEAGRDRLRHIVGRDTAELSVTVVRESALESLAENLNDSFVAPLFWFCLGGLPGAARSRCLCAFSIITMAASTSSPPMPS